MGNGRNMRIFEDFADTLAAALGAVGSYLLILPYINLNVAGVHRAYIFLIFRVIICSLVYRLSGLNADVGRFAVRRSYFGRLTSSEGAVLVTSFALAVAFGGRYEKAAMTLALASSLLTVFIILLRRAVTKCILRIAGGRTLRAVIVGDSPESAAAFVKMVGKNGRIELLGAVGETLASLECPRLGALSELECVLDRLRPDYAVLAMSSYDRSKLAKIVSFCDDRCVRVYFLPIIYGFFKTARQIEYISSLPLINVHSTPLDERANTAVKRAVDLIGSLALIILTMPIMLVCAVGVRLSSPGPIIFRQRRVGRLGRSFTMLKFRSMVENSASDTAWTRGDDRRKTRFGAFLRRTSLDELPQLFNVLLGDMSLVGPRPELPHFVEKFKREIPLYMVKHYVKPGLTGLAQIKGLRGDTSIEQRIEADLCYIESWSVWLDIKILLLTPFRAINKNEKYSREE